MIYLKIQNVLHGEMEANLCHFHDQLLLKNKYSNAKYICCLNLNAINITTENKNQTTQLAFTNPYSNLMMTIRKRHTVHLTIKS